MLNRAVTAPPTPMLHIASVGHVVPVPGHSAQPAAQTLASQFCSHLLDPPSPASMTQQDVPLSFFSQLPWVPLSVGEAELSFTKFTLDAW